MSGPHSSPLGGLTVLVVDDNLDQLTILGSLLRFHGARVVETEDGKTALLRLRKTDVDVIVSDIAMPGFSGHDFIRAVRMLEGETGRHVPAIALTGFNEPGQRATALASGFQAYMLKPFDIVALLRAITQLAGREDPTARP